MARLLDCDDDRDEWLRWWNATGRDPFAHPAYAKLFVSAGSRPFAWIQEYADGIVLLPIIVRPIPDAAGLQDVTSPYGYGGPFFAGEPGLNQVLADFGEWLQQEGMCSGFLRLSLDIATDNALSPAGCEIRSTAENVTVNLRREPEAIWMGYEHKVRKNVQKAIRLGCTVRRDSSLAHVPGFLSVYEATMQRNNASSWYRFGEAFFAKLGQELYGSYSVFSVLDPHDSIVSVELVLEGPKYLYSFLGGTVAEAFSLRPNDLLKHEVVRHGQRTGRSGFVLGGGYSGEDGIFRYKRSFDPTGVHAFYTVRFIGDPKIYAELVAERAGLSTERIRSSDYFPSYRAS